MILSAKSYLGLLFRAIICASWKVTIISAGFNYGTMKADLLMQRAGQSLHCECSLQEQAERARHPYAHGCAWVSERQKICHYGEVRDLSFSECCRSLCFAFGIFVFFRCKSKKLAPLCFICFNSQVFFFLFFFYIRLHPDDISRLWHQPGDPSIGVPQSSRGPIGRAPSCISWNQTLPMHKLCHPNYLI